MQHTKSYSLFLLLNHGVDIGNAIKKQSALVLHESKATRFYYGESFQ